MSSPELASWGTNTGINTLGSKNPIIIGSNYQTWVNPNGIQMISDDGAVAFNDGRIVTGTYVTNEPPPVRCAKCLNEVDIDETLDLNVVVENTTHNFEVSVCPECYEMIVGDSDE